ncbi:MAG: hypothetical protein ACK4UJ_10230 [Leptonema sp. (in: bacteria)]
MVWINGLANHSNPLLNFWLLSSSATAQIINLSIESKFLKLA